MNSTGVPRRNSARLSAARMPTPGSTTGGSNSNNVSVPAVRRGKRKNVEAEPTNVQRKRAKKDTAPINTPPTVAMNLYACGSNDNGELGLGKGAPTGSVVRPRLLKDLAESGEAGRIVQVAVGGMHTAALTATNKILTWGVNDNGALGRDTTWAGGLRDAGSDEDSNDGDLNPKEATPLEVEGSFFPPNSLFVQVAASDSATFVLTSQGQVFGWGTFRGTDGIIGFSPTARVQQTPQQIPGLAKITRICCGSNHVLALDSSGRVFAWGCGEQGQLARRILARHAHRSLLPQSVGLKGIKEIGAGSEHSFALGEDGRVWSWGANGFGQTGVLDKTGKPEESVLRPSIIEGFKDIPGKVAQIVGGNHHSLAVTDDGGLFAWGRADSMACGIQIPPPPAPQITTPEPHVAMSVPLWARDNPDDSDIVMWDASVMEAEAGPGSQVVDESVILRDDSGRARIIAVPTPVPGLAGVLAAAAGSDHSLAVQKDGRVLGWGFNTMGQVGVGTEDDVDSPTLLNGKAIRDQNVVWAGCGGQFSLLGTLA